MTITPITKNQGLKIADVTLWLALSFIITLIPAYISKHYLWLAGVPVVNLLIFTLSQLFQTELSQSEQQLSPVDRVVVNQVESQAGQLIRPSVPPTSATPVSPPAP